MIRDVNSGNTGRRKETRVYETRMICVSERISFRGISRPIACQI